jgi:hypothetical protein
MPKPAPDSKIKTLEFVKDRIVVHTDSGLRLKTAVSRFPSLARAPADVRGAFKLDESRVAVYWPELELRLSLEELTN